MLVSKCIIIHVITNFIALLIIYPVVRSVVEENNPKWFAFVKHTCLGWTPKKPSNYEFEFLNRTESSQPDGRKRFMSN